MRITTYTRYSQNPADALNLESLIERLSEFLLDGGFAGGPHFHPYWGWSGLEDTSSVDALKQALLQALVATGQLTPEMLKELRADDPGDPEVRREIAELLDRLVEKMVEEGYLTLSEGETGTGPGAGPGMATVDEAREAAEQVHFQMTRKGLDFLGYRALRTLLNPLGRSSAGGHETRETASGVDADAGSRSWEFGDTLNLDIAETLRNAIGRRGPAIPIELDYRDLMVHQSQYRSSCATVLMLDISHSMVLYGEDRFIPAKKVALALHHLIRTRYPGDSLRVVTFGDRATEIPLARLASAQVGPFHTNTAEGLKLSRRVLRAQKQDMRQIIMITDGKPSAITLPRGRIYRNSAGLDRRILQATYQEAAACRRSGIPINTFMLAQDEYLVRFVRRLTTISRGKACFVSPMTLGQFVMLDFLKQRRSA